MAGPTPQLFDVLPSGKLKWALQQSLPQGTTLKWQPVGILPVTAGELAVMDAASCHPKYLQGEAKRLPWPHAEAEVWLQLAVEPDGRATRVVGVAVARPGESPAGSAERQVTEACSMAIDSATALVGDWGRMQTGCKIGGPLCQASLGKSTDKPEEQQSKEQALVLLKRNGFFGMEMEKWKTSSSISYRFPKGLSDVELARADALLAAAKSSERAYVWESQTQGEVAARLKDSLFGQLDAAGSPMLFAFRTGFGDGIYFWDTLRDGEQVVGYACSFLVEEEVEVAAESPSAPPQPTGNLLPADPGSPLALAQQGFLVAVLWAPRLWLHAKAVAGNDREGTLLMADGSTRVVPRNCIVGIPDQASFQVGHQVLARWQNQAMFPGTIRAASPQGFTVAWHDGDTPLVVPAGAITYLQWSKAAQPVQASLQVAAVPAGNRAIELTTPSTPKPSIVPGACIAVRTQMPMQFVRVEGAVPGGFAVQKVDGTRGTIPTADAVPVPPTPVFQVGDIVLAQWKSGTMFPGTITQISEQGYTVAWHDGDTPLVVPLGCLTYLYWALEGNAQSSVGRESLGVH